MNYVMLYLPVREKNAIYIHFVCSLQLKLFFFTLLLDFIKMFVENQYLVYNTYIFYSSHIVFQHLMIWLLLYVFWVPYFLGFSVFNHKQNTFKGYPQPLL